jgi:hypothetical protein
VSLSETSTTAIWTLPPPPRYLRRAVRSRREEIRMAFTFKLETADGTPAEPPTFKTVAPLWRSGDTIPLGARTLRVVDVRDGRDDEDPILVVEDTQG